MERIYQVIIKAPININPGVGQVYKFMPGESHALPEHLGKEIFREGSPYLSYFSLVDIQPPLEVVTKEESLEEVLKASSEPALNTLSTVTAKAPEEKVEVKAPAKTEVPVKTEELPKPKVK